MDCVSSQKFKGHANIGWSRYINVDREQLRSNSHPTMVWPFGPSASFQAIVSGKRAQRDDAIKDEVAALKANCYLTTEEVKIVSKSGKLLVRILWRPVSRSDGARLGDRQIHTGSGVHFDSGSQSVHQVCSHRPNRD